MDYICSPFTRTLWELSSAGLEHLPYKQRVTGSNPVAPTTKSRVLKGQLLKPFFICIQHRFISNFKENFDQSEKF